MNGSWTWKQRLARLSPWVMVLIVLLGVLAIQECRVRALQDDLYVAKAGLTDAALKEAGLHRALATKPKEVLVNVPLVVTKEVEKVVKSHQLDPVTSSHVESEPVVVYLEGTCDSEPPPPVEVQLTSDFLVGMALPSLEPWFKSTSQVRLTTPTEEETVLFDESNTKASVTFSDTIVDKVRFARDFDRFHLLPTAPKYWRMGPVVGVGGYVGTTGEIGTGAFVGWGVQF